MGLVQEHMDHEVSLAETGGEWHVMVKESGCETVTRTFEIEAFAVSYAEGQKLRLQLDKVIRL